MADFFNDLGKKLTEVADEVGRKAGDTFEVQKIKSDIRSLKRANERDYADIGRMVYEKFCSNEIEDLAYAEICEAIEKREESIEEKEEEIVKIQGV